MCNNTLPEHGQKVKIISSSRGAPESYIGKIGTVEYAYTTHDRLPDYCIRFDGIMGLFGWVSWRFAFEDFELV